MSDERTSECEICGIARVNVTEGRCFNCADVVLPTPEEIRERAQAIKGRNFAAMASTELKRARYGPRRPLQKKTT
jgi:hypothetical protein